MARRIFISALTLGAVLLALTPFSSMSSFADTYTSKFREPRWSNAGQLKDLNVDSDPCANDPYEKLQSRNSDRYDHGPGYSASSEDVETGRVTLENHRLTPEFEVDILLEQRTIGGHPVDIRTQQLLPEDQPSDKTYPQGYDDRDCLFPEK